LSKAEAVHGRLVEALRRDLIVPGPQDADIRDEPARWYLAGNLAPAPAVDAAAWNDLAVRAEPIFLD
jgi:hypothetical protein